MLRLGVDFGGVIVPRATGEEDTSFFDGNPMQTPQVPGAIEALTTINIDSPFTDNTWVVSKGSPNTEAKTRHWLAAHDFYDQTLIWPERVLFTPKRIGKLAIAQELELTHFVDDTIEVLGYLAGTVPNLYLFNSDPNAAKGYETILSQITRVTSWPELTDLLQAAA